MAETAEVEVPPAEDSVADVSMEVDSKGPEDTKPDSAGKKEYSEEERLKRKEFFKKLNEKRKVAKDKYRQNLLNRFVKKPVPYSSGRKQVVLSRDILSRDMSEEEKRMLDFYIIRLSTLRSENEMLHKRLAYLVNENMKYLQKGPPKKKV